MPSSPTTWTSAHGCLHENQVCSDGLHGFRYLRIALDALINDSPYSSPNGTVYISSIALNFTAYHGTPATYTGWFECSDEDLTQFWYDAAYTAEMCIDTFDADYVEPRDAASPNLLGKRIIFDGAKRDRDPYVGDLAVAGRTIYLAHSEAADTARSVLEDLAEHQRCDGWIPPASMYVFHPTSCYFSFLKLC